MFELLAHSVKEKVTISEEDFEFCKTLFIPRKLRKRQFLLQEGDVCRYTAFVEKGILRNYFIDEKGNEAILQFAQEGWWAADLYSFMTDEPSRYNIEAMEDCELLLLNRSSWEVLFEKLPVFERYFRLLLQNNLIATQRRLLGSLTETAEQKYLKFIANYPDCSQRIPQHMIASYLGITRETLSRVRSQLATRK
jgi:CRP-like cAMP-binding protein